MEIEEEREAMNIKPKTVDQVVTDFKKLNYLLSEVKVPSVKKSVSACPPVDEKGLAKIDAESLAILDECIKHDPETKRMHTVEITDENGEITFEYTPERKKLHKEIILDLTKETQCIKQEQPIALLTGGSPASGKSSFLNKYAPYLGSDKIWHVDADAVRDYLPEYKGWNSSSTHNEVRDITAELLNSFDKPCKHDVLYDGTMTNSRKYLDLIRRFKKLGYRVFIAFMIIPKDVTIERALNRYRNNKGGKTPVGRYVPVAVIEDFFKTGTEVFEEIKSAVDGYILVDSLTQKIIERGGEDIPKNRPYSVIFEGKEPEKIELTKLNYKDSLEGAKIMISMAANTKEKKEWKAYIDGLKTMIELM